jgi:hypothetical protein
VSGISQIILEVEDQGRALGFWAGRMNFELVRNAAHGDGRWLEVRTPDKAVTVVLVLPSGEPPADPEALPTAIVFVYRDDRSATCGWWLTFQDSEGNRFALMPPAISPHRRAA